MRLKLWESGIVEEYITLSIARYPVGILLMHSDFLWDAISSQSSQGLQVKLIQCGGKHLVSEAVSSSMSQSWLWVSQVYVITCTYIYIHTYIFICMCLSMYIVSLSSLKVLIIILNIISSII